LYLYILVWKIGNLLDTFYSLNANKIAQSAGNLNALSVIFFTASATQGSSETIRGNTYDLFRKNYFKYFNHAFCEKDE